MPPLSEEAKQILRDTNPWWVPPHRARPDPPTYERPAVAAIMDSLAPEGARIQVLRGPRQVGKSTAMLQVVRKLLAHGTRPTDILFVRFDLEVLREQAGLLDILRWFGSEIRKQELTDTPTAYLLLDEIHKLDDWSAQVKHVFDTYRPKMMLTGSSSVLVARGQRESLAGRALTTEIPPMQFREVLELTQAGGLGSLPQRLRWSSVVEHGVKTIDTFAEIHRQPAQRRHSWLRKLERYYNRGGYPDLHTGAVEEDRWADYLVETVFERVLGVDIPDLFPVDQPRLLRHLYLEVARRTGQEIAQKKLAEDSAVSGYATNQPTVGRYLHYLADALLIREFSRFPLARKAAARTPMKITLTDLGVRNAIFRGAPSLAESSPDVIGPLVETLVQTVLRGTSLQTHFYRDLRDPNKPRGGFDEVDFVVEMLDGTVVPVEVKFRRQVQREDLGSLFRFMNKYKPPIGIVVTRETYEEFPADRVILLPLLDFLLAF